MRFLFVHDYYYSSIPISYSKCWLPIVGIFISLLSIAYCIFAAMLLISIVADAGSYEDHHKRVWKLVI